MSALTDKIDEAIAIELDFQAKAVISNAAQADLDAAFAARNAVLVEVQALLPPNVRSYLYEHATAGKWDIRPDNNPNVALYPLNTLP